MDNNNNFDNKSYNPYNYNYTTQMDYFKKLEQENAMLKQQVRQKQFIDPLRDEWEKSSEYQEMKKNSVLTFLLYKFFGEYEASDIKKQFDERDGIGFERFKTQKGVPPNQNAKPNINNNVL